MLKNAIKSNYWGGHFAKSGPKNGGGGARRCRNFFPAESVWGKIFVHLTNIYLRDLSEVVSS